MAPDPDDEEAEHSRDSDFDSVLRKAARVDDVPIGSILPWRGQIVGSKYRIEGMIGRGGMGAVFRATHVVTEKAVALKWMLHSGSDERARRRFVREALAAGRIDHPNVVDVYDVGQEGDCTYLVMELLHGGTLRARMQAGMTPFPEMIALLLPAMRGVAAMHRAGVIHRDLKPENIFLCTGPDGSAREAKVLDFGVSIVTSNGPLGSTLAQSGHATVVGTPAYMSPEQIEHPSDVDLRADVYAFGAILYDALTGQLPCGAGGGPASILAILREPPKDPCELRPELPRALGDALLRALSKRPEERYDSMERFLSAVQPFASAQTAPTVAVASTTNQRRTWLLSGGALLLLLLLAAARTFFPADPTHERAAGQLLSTNALYRAKPPFLSGTACSQCLAQDCSEQDNACSEDPDCTKIRARMSRAKAPLIAAREVWRELYNARWSNDHGQGNSARLRDDLQHCARARCDQACDTGRKFACVGKFDYPASYPTQTRLKLRFKDSFTEQGIAGLHIRACAPGTQCERPLGEADSEAGGFANMLIDFSRLPHRRTALEPEFTGYLLLDETADRPPAVLFFPKPVFDQTYARFYQDTRSALSHILGSRNLPGPDATHGLLDMQVEDCEGFSVSGATLEIWNLGVSGYTRCNNCSIWYPDVNGNPDVTLSELNSKSGDPARTVLPPGDVLVVARDKSTQLPLALSPVYIRAAHQHTLKLYPASARELKSLPGSAER